VAPWLYPGRIGRSYVSEDLWRKLIVPTAVSIILGVNSLRVLMWMTT
jgi:hypothetical protein